MSQPDNEPNYSPLTPPPAPLLPADLVVISHDADRVGWAREVQQAMRTLDPEIQSIIQMLYFEDSGTQASIALANKRPVGELAHVVARALQQIAEVLTG